MPKSRKKKNADFQKVKLKVGRQLPKGGNETNISFKSRTIRITQHINDTSNLAEPHRKHKHVLQDLLPQCEHYNARVRLAGVQGITELMTANPDTILKDIGRVINKVLYLLNDRDPLIRQAVLKLFKMIFGHIDAKAITSSFKILSAHLCCAMTHICDDVQKDSLDFFDLLLDNFPTHVISDVSQLMTIFLEQISTQVSKGKNADVKARMLVVNPNSKLSSQKWRAKVLERLKKLLDAFLTKDTCKDDTESNEVTSLHVAHWPGMRGPLVPSWVRGRWSQSPLSFQNLLCPNSEKNEYSNLLSSKKKLQKFTESLMPLLKQCWAEDCPLSDSLTADKGVSKGVQVTEQAVPMLASVVGVLHSLAECWNNFNRTQQSCFDSQFQDTFLKELRQLLMSSFPLNVIETVKRTKDGQIVRSSSGLQTSVLKLNLTVCDIMVRLPIKTEKIRSTEENLWQADVISYMVNHTEECTGPELSHMLTSVLKKFFFNFPVSVKQEKLLKKTFTQYKKARPQSVGKRCYLSLFESLALDEHSPFFSRPELFDSFFSSLPDLLLQLPKETSGVAMLVIRIMNRGGQQNCQPLITTLRKNVNKLFDQDRGILAVGSKDIHKPFVEIINWIFRLNPPSEEELKLFAQNCRLPVVDIEVAKYLISILDNGFKTFQHEEAVILKPHQPKMMTFLLGLIVGQTKEETEQFQRDHQYPASHLIHIVWQCPLSDLLRHRQLVEWCKVAFRGYLTPLLLFNVMAHIWCTKVIKCYHSINVCMLYGILQHWMEMLQNLPTHGNIIHTDSYISLDYKENDSVQLAVESVATLTKYLPDIARLCLSTVYDLVAMETSEGTLSDGVDTKIRSMLLDQAMKLAAFSLRIIVQMCVLMTDLIKTDRGQKEIFTVVVVATRLLQSSDLAQAWAKDQGEALAQLLNLRDSILEALPEVSEHQLWHDFLYAVKIHSQHLGLESSTHKP